jgi:hypothetical protein
MAKNNKFSRTEMWAWFSSYEIPKRKLPRKKRERENDGKFIRYAAKIEKDRLVIGMWRGHKGEPMGLYYITAKGSTNVCTDGETWHTGKCCYLPTGGYDYWGSYYGYSFNCVGGESEARDWMREKWGSNFWYYDRRDTIDLLDLIESHISAQRRLNAKERRLKKWSDYCENLPPMPADLETWASEVVFGAREYAFGRKDSNVYHCTACGKTHHKKDWKHRARYTCPTTGKRIKVDKVNTSMQARERIMIIQSHHDIKGEICSVARHFTAVKNWNVSGSNFRIWPDAILVLRLNGATVCGDDIIYNIRDGVWDVRNTSGYSHQKCFCYPDVSALDGTAYSGVGIDAAAAKGWRLHYNNLMRGWYDDPRMEYLIKGNFYTLVSDMASYNGAGINLNKGTNIQDVLGLDGQGVARLRENDGGTYYLAWLRTAFVCKYKIPESTLQYFCDKKITPKDIAFALQLGMSPEQVGNYLKKPHGYGPKDRHYYSNFEHYVIEQWKDCISMAGKLKLDTSNPAVHKPKDLKWRHDELVEIFNQQKDELERERIESEYPKIKPVCESIKALYEWGDGTYEVVVPSGAADIMREGRLLRHCVGSSDRYFDRVAEEESYIMFLRKSSDKTRPWYTMEVEPGGCIRQLRTIGDAEGADRSEAKAFLSKWRKEIAHRLGDAERKAAEISREKRLQEFEELRRGGNIIRNGKLAGKLLVEVLEADFKEYNEEYITA